MHRLTLALRRLRRSVLARRRPLAALCAAVAVTAALRANAAPTEPRTAVLTAAHDLPAGVVVGPDDLRRTPFAPGSVPAGVLSRHAVLGRTTAGPVRSGEPVTDTRLVTASLLEGYPGLVAVPVRIGDPGSVRLLRVGDRVDLVAADPQGERDAVVVGRGVPVLAIPRARDPGPTGGALVVLGLPETSVGAVARASVTAFLSVVVIR
jgi:Flp pilus assembly protein CpaB